MANMMDELMASLDKKKLSLTRGEQVTGKVVMVTDSDIIIDLDSKYEGVIPKKDLPDEELAAVTVGDEVVAYVKELNDASGQALLSIQQQLIQSRTSSKKWEKVLNAFNKRSTLKVKAIEVNKGGLLVATDTGVRGFLPSSQVNFSQNTNLSDLVGKELNLSILEVDPQNNRLILTQRGKISDDLKQRLAKFKAGDKTSGQVVAVLPFGLFIDLGGVSEARVGALEGLVHVSDVSWSRVEDLNQLYKVGDEIQAEVISVDEELGRVNLSVKNLQSDPFLEYIKDHQSDDVVSGEVIRLTETGVVVKLSEGVEGLLPAASFEPGVKYQEGDKLQLLIDNIDESRHRITLAPFLTSTEGLLYK